MRVILSVILPIRACYRYMHVCCVDCLPGTFSSAAAASCSVCPTGSTSNPAASTCACNSGYSTTGTGFSLTCTGTRVLHGRPHQLALDRVATNAGRVLHGHSMRCQHVRRRCRCGVLGLPQRKHQRDRILHLHLQPRLLDRRHRVHPSLLAYVTLTHHTRALLQSPRN